MNPKLEKYRDELARNSNRIAALQERNAVLGKKVAELENLELRSLLLGANMSYQDLASYIQSMAGAQPASEAAREEDMYEDETDETETAHAAED